MTFVQRIPRNCWHPVCSRCGKFKPVAGGKRKPRFVCAECLAKREAA